MSDIRVPKSGDYLRLNVQSEVILKVTKVKVLNKTWSADTAMWALTARICWHSTKRGWIGTTDTWHLNPVDFAFEDHNWLSRVGAAGASARQGGTP